MKPPARRRAAESKASNRRPPPPTPTNTIDPWSMLSTPVTGRDTDASFCSSRSSVASNTGRHSAAVPNISDRSYQVSALRTINAYIASQGLSFSLKHPLPSAKDINETLKFLLNKMGFTGEKMDEDLFDVLKFLKCPLKLNKSALRAPGTPHFWPNLLAVIHWLVQMVKYMDFLEESPEPFEQDMEFMYTINSYLHYINGDDDAVNAMDEQRIRELEGWNKKQEEVVKGLEEHEKKLELTLEGLKGIPSRKEVLEQEQAVLEQDVKKFHVMIKQLDWTLVELQNRLEEKDKALTAKEEERKMVCKENFNLKKKMEEQGVNFLDAERWKRELQDIERDVDKTNVARNDYEEKILELNSRIEEKFKELEELAMECNRAIGRLKLKISFEYQLKSDGSTPSKILGLDYKTVLKPALALFEKDIKSKSIGKLDDLMSLQKQSDENAKTLLGKRNQKASLQSQIIEVESQLVAISKETHEHASKSAAEARKLAEEVDMEAQELCATEKEAEEFLKASKAELQETILRMDERVKSCSQELLLLINTVSANKEYVESKIARMRNELIETVGAMADAYKTYQASQGLLPKVSENP